MSTADGPLVIRRPVSYRPSEQGTPRRQALDRPGPYVGAGFIYTSLAVENGDILTMTGRPRVPTGPQYASLPSRQLVRHSAGSGGN